MTLAATEIVTREGLRYAVDPLDARAQALIASAGEFNLRSVRVFRGLLGLRDWDLVVDIGANYGEMISALQGCRVPRVLAFEPNTRLHPYLHRTAQLNGVALEIRPEAVGARTGRAQFQIDLEWSGTSSLIPGTAGHRTETTEVEVITLDDWFATDPARTALIKMDVEGAELDVLAGAERFLAGLDDCAVQFELLHMAPPDIAALAARWRLYLISAESLAWVRMPGGLPALVEAFLATGRFYQNDALLLPKNSALGR